MFSGEDKTIKNDTTHLYKVTYTIKLYEAYSFLTQSVDGTSPFFILLDVPTKIFAVFLKIISELNLGISKNSEGH